MQRLGCDLRARGCECDVHADVILSLMVDGLVHMPHPPKGARRLSSPIHMDVDRWRVLLHAHGCLRMGGELGPA